MAVLHSTISDKSSLFRYGTIASRTVLALHKMGGQGSLTARELRLIGDAEQMLADIVNAHKFLILESNSISPTSEALSAYACAKEVIAGNAWRFSREPTPELFESLHNTLTQLHQRQSVSPEAITEAKTFFRSVSDSMLSELTSPSENESKSSWLN